MTEQHTSTVTATPFATVEDEEDLDVVVRKHAIIGFWRKETGIYKCHRQIRVEHPLLLSPQDEGSATQDLLFVSDDK
jgi:hypothetical protein